jgi:2-polyprenyl-6-methoxyphenol hydroxylase-like FAD-dependent oxidoreductase
MAWLATRVSVADLKRQITIAGGGLAGLSLAISLRRQGVPVTLWEAGNYPRHRVCGEFISGVSEDTLASLGISAAFAGALHHRTLEWRNCGRLLHRDHLLDPALGISRHLLDERLRQLAFAAGVELKTGVRARPEPREGLVWAAGRRPCNGRWIGLKAHVHTATRPADLEMHLGTNGYVGLAGVEDGWTNICGLFRVDRSIQAKGHELLLSYLTAGGHHDLVRTLSQARWREASFCAVAGFELGRQPEIPGLVTLGDAQAMIPPFTGNGMAMAFQAAARTTDFLVAWSQGDRSWEDSAEQIKSSLRQDFRRRLHVSSALHPILLTGPGRLFLRQLARCRLLPFHSLLALNR